MANKADFTAEEWNRLLASPMVAGMAITAADPGGLWSLIKEGMAGVQSLLEVRRNPQANPLVRAVAEDFATEEGSRAARDAIGGYLGGGQLERLKAAALAELGAVAAMLDAKAPGDAPGFKTWLYEVAEKAAEAGTEGGFLGFGGVAVSEAEKATLAEISKALGSGITASR